MKSFLYIARTFVARLMCLLSLGLAMALLPNLALACRIYIDPSQRVRASFDAVVVVATTSWKRTGPQQPDYWPWMAEGRLVSVVEGQEKAPIWAFGGSQSSAACDLRTPPKSEGELWVLYIRRSAEKKIVHQAYPLEMMLKGDPRFAGWPSSKR